MSTVTSEVEHKLGRIRRELEACGLDGLLLTTQPNVSWILGGRDHWVSRTLERSFAWVHVSAERFQVLALDNEEARLRDELGVEDLGAELITPSWWSSLEALASTVTAARIVNDGHGPGDRRPEIAQRLRLVLTEAERARLAQLGDDTCTVVEDALLGLDAAELAGLTERDLGARVVGGLESGGVVAAGIMVGGAGRRQRFRHPVVTNAPVGRDVLVVVVAVRGGLHVALSRTVSAGPVERALAERHELACAVEASMIAASRPGRSWTDALEAGLRRYADGGATDEWRAHTQGGPIGYGPREYVAYPRGCAPAAVVQPSVLEHQAYAWNPTVLGAKSEDTFLVAADGWRPVSNSSRWPALEIETPHGAVARPAVLEV